MGAIVGYSDAGMVMIVMDKDGCWLCYLVMGNVVKLPKLSKP